MDGFRTLKVIGRGSYGRAVLAEVRAGGAARARARVGEGGADG